MLSKIKQTVSFSRKLLYSWMNSDFNEVNLCNRFPILSYSKSTKCFSINNGDLTSDELVNVRRTLMSELRMIIPQSYIKIDEIITALKEIKYEFNQNRNLD